MNRILKRVLIIGGGFSGMSAAIQLRKQGVAVQLVEIDAEWRNYGAGISLGGPTLRALETLGILDAYMKEGFVGQGVEIRAADGKVLQRLPSPSVVGSHLKGDGAVMRPALAKILAATTRASGTEIYLGCTFTAIKQTDDGVEVQFSDGRTERFDLVIGADGVHSSVRSAVFPDAPTPAFTGQGVWRAVLPRIPGIDCTTLWVSANLKAGLNPVSNSMMYLFLNEQRAQDDWVEESDFPRCLSELLTHFSAPELKQVAAMINEDAAIIYRPLQKLLVNDNWHLGNVVLIGDTVHATTPHLAAGACIGIEDAIVLADELAKSDSIPEALAAFQQRRMPRCAMVVNNSMRLGEIEQTGGSQQEHAQIMRESFMALAQPI